MKKVLYLLSIGVITLLTLNSCSKDEEPDPQFFYGEYVGNCGIKYFDSGVELRSLEEVDVDCSVQISENVNISNELFIHLIMSGSGRYISLTCNTDDLDCFTTVEKEDVCRLKSGHSLRIKKQSGFDNTTFSDFSLDITKKNGVFDLHLYLGSKKSTQIRVQTYK